MTAHYPEKLERLLDAYLTHKVPNATFLDLSTALGCLSETVVASTVVLVRPEPPLLEHEPLVCRTLIAALRRHITLDNSYADGCALMSALVINERWRACLISDEAALDFAVLALTFTRTKNTSPLYSAIAPSFCSVMCQWLGRTEHYHSPPDVRMLAQEFFGIAWVELVLPNYQEETGVKWRADVVARVLRPPLMPGLCPASVVISGEDLPALA